MKKILVFALAAVMALVSCGQKNDPSIPAGSLEGRWNAPRSEEQPDDYCFSLVFSGTNKLELYVIAYGWRCTGTYTFSNDAIHYSITEISQSLSGVTFDEHGVINSGSGGMDSLNPDTLQPSEGYAWYPLNNNRQDLYDEYVVNYASFTFKLTSDTTAESNLMGPSEKYIFTKQQ